MGFNPRPFVPPVIKVATKLVGLIQVIQLKLDNEPLNRNPGPILSVITLLIRFIHCPETGESSQGKEISIPGECLFENVKSIPRRFVQAAVKDNSR